MRAFASCRAGNGPEAHSSCFHVNQKVLQMSLTPPSFPIFFIAVLAGGAGIAAKLGYVAAIAPYAFWLVAVGFGLLALGSLLRGL